MLIFLDWIFINLLNKIEKYCRNSIQKSPSFLSNFYIFSTYFKVSLTGKNFIVSNLNFAFWMPRNFRLDKMVLNEMSNFWMEFRLLKICNFFIHKLKLFEFEWHATKVCRLFKKRFCSRIPVFRIKENSRHSSLSVSSTFYQSPLSFFSYSSLKVLFTFYYRNMRV